MSGFTKHSKKIFRELHNYDKTDLARKVVEFTSPASEDGEDTDSVVTVWVTRLGSYYITTNHNEISDEWFSDPVEATKVAAYYSDNDEIANYLGGN